MTASGKTKNKDDQYTKPELRDEVKAEIMAGDKGGKPGQWSARKAQLVAHEYEARGGGYKHERTAAQEHLHEWTAEHWQTSDGKPAERDGKTTRYLPEAAWKALSPAEKKATNAKKVKGSQQGKQYVANTSSAAEARRSAEAPSDAPEKTAGTAAAPKHARAARSEKTTAKPSARVTDRNKAASGAKTSAATGPGKTPAPQRERKGADT